MAQPRRYEGLSDAARAGKEDVVAVLKPVQLAQLLQLCQAEPVRGALVVQVQIVGRRQSRKPHPYRGLLLVPAVYFRLQHVGEEVVVAGGVALRLEKHLRDVHRQGRQPESARLAAYCLYLLHVMRSPLSPRMRTCRMWLA